MRKLFAFLPLACVLSATPPDFKTLLDQGHAALEAFDLPTAHAAVDSACVAERASYLPYRPEQSALCAHYSAAIADALGRDEEAAALYREAVALWEHAGSAFLASRITSMTNLGAIYRHQRRFEEAEATLSRALDLATADPAMKAAALDRMGALYADLGQTERARAMLEESRATLRALPAQGVELARAEDALGMLELHSGHYKTGETNLRTAVSLASSVLGEENPETGAYSTDLALALMVQGQFDRAEILLRRARFVIESRLGPDTVQLVNTLAELTSVERELGHYGQAEDYGEKALRLMHSHLPSGRDENDSLEMVLLQANLGNLYVREHKTAEAERLLPGAVAAERRFFKNERALADGLRNLALLRCQQLVWAEAESLYREAIGDYEREIGADHPDLAPVLREYAAVLKRLGAPKAQVKKIEARARSIAAV